MADFDQFKNAIQSVSKGMTASQKLTIGTTILVTLVGFFLLLRWATKPDYALLFSELDLKEADQIVESLRTEGVSYKLGSGGRSVRIPSKDVYEWRMKLASQGLPTSGGIGYEVFDKKNIGISDFVQKINFQRALEGELSRTIRGIASIQDVRVHIVIPEERLFKEDQQNATASIVLNIQSGRRVSEDQIFGITNLVAASVEGLMAENVTVVDSHGNILSNRWKQDSVIGLSSSQLELRQNVEGYLEEKSRSMLATVLGEAKAIVRVSADLNFQKIERTDERYDPDNVAVLSEEITDQTSTPAAGGNSGQTQHTITNYQVPRTIEHITNSVGNIQRLSVAVIVDGSIIMTPDANGVDQEEYRPRTADEMAMFTAVVQNAVGFDPLRNDQLEIRNIQFYTPQEEAIPEAPPFYTQPEVLISVGQKVLPVVFLFILIFILRSKLKKVKLRLPTVSTPTVSLSTAATVVPNIEDNATPEAVESATLLKQISNFAEEKPTLAARLLRYWMIEE